MLGNVKKKKNTTKKHPKQQNQKLCSVAETLPSM